MPRNREVHARGQAIKAEEARKVVEAFVRDHAILGDAGDEHVRVARAVLYARYREYAVKLSKPPLSAQAFNVELARAVPTATVIHGRYNGPHWGGILYRPSGSPRQWLAPAQAAENRLPDVTGGTP